MIRFDLLGTFLIQHNGTVTTIGAAKQRAIIALLLISRGHTVSTTRLIAELWGDDAPPSAQGTLLSLVSRIRRSFTVDPCMDKLLLKQGRGYRLALGDAFLVDFHEFDERAARIRSRFAEDPTADIDDAVAEALGLWHGDAFADIPSTPLVSVEAERLEQSRLEILEMRAENWLTHGRHADVVEQNRPLVAAHPLRERLWEQLMLAHHRAGRRIEALRVYERARSTLLSELGVGPGPDLRLLHRQIEENKVPDRRPTELTVTARVPPRQLPPDIADFTGREEAVADVDRLLGSPTSRKAVPVVAIYGMPGLGKTTFAVHVAHRLSDTYPDGQLFIDLKGAQEQVPTSYEVMHAFLRGVGVTEQRIPLDYGERISLYRSVLAGRRILIVLDNAADETQVEPLVPGSPTCAVLVTSGRRLSALFGARQLRLDLFSHRQAIRFLRDVVGADRVAREPESSAEIVELCGRHPLSLRICATRLASRPHWSLMSLCRRLADKDLRLAELAYGNHDVRAGFGLSYASLDEAGRRLFCLLGILQVEDFASWLAAPLLDVSIHEAEARLELLVESQLLHVAQQEGAGEPRYYFHELIRLYSRGLAEHTLSVAERSQALARVTGFAAGPGPVSRGLRPGRHAALSRSWGSPG
ncbi:hypothetical protein GCM10023191_043390 [Actinoallomurus oryzae]|uniref:OmpR/PhoB-type domain-containing protein n=1 Tax=Actinoallomurus oryzae TaxID=502180 RepID=A0ABP8Q9Q7_9ACTN